MVHCVVSGALGLGGGRWGVGGVVGWVGCRGVWVVDCVVSGVLWCEWCTVL